MTKRKIKRYKVSPDDSVGLAMSVVTKGAVESDFHFFSEQRMEKFVGVEGERRMIYGCALRPDFPIYRNNGEEEYYLEFSKEAVDKISKNYFKMGFQSNWTEGHKEEVEGLTITESWLKESMTLDKSIALGLDPDLPLGTWFIGCHCENDDIWKSVVEGTYNGFSIEAVVGLEEFESQINNNENNDNSMTNEEMLSKIKEMFNQLIASVSMSKQEDDIEPISIEDMAEQTPSEPTEPQPTEAPTEAVAEEPKIETPNEEPKPTEEPVVEEPKPTEEAPKDNHLEDLIKSLKDEVEALKKMNSSLNSKVKTLEKTPSAQPVNVQAKPSGGVGGNTYTAWRETMRQMIG